MKVAPSGVVQLNGWPHKCLDGRIAQRHGTERIAKFREISILTTAVFLN